MPQDWFSQYVVSKPSMPLIAPMPSHGQTSPAKKADDWFSQFEVPADAPTHPLATLGQAVIEGGQGAGAGLTSTIFHGGDVIRRALGMERVIDTPEVQQAMTPPDTLAGHLGYLAEQGAEYYLAYRALGQGVEGASILARLMAEGVTSAVVAGVQSGGDPGQMATAGALGVVAPPVVSGLFKGGRMVVGAAQRAAAGAAEGGLGGAVAAALRTAAPLKPKTLIIQALKPRAVLTNIDQTLTRALPELKATEPALGRPITGVDDLLEASTLAKQRVRAQYDEMMGPKKAIGSTVDLTPVADAMERSIPSKVKLEDPRAAAAILDKADIYRAQRFPIEDAEQLLKETNAELDSYYHKYPGAQRKAVTADPEVAHLVAQAKALRSAIYATLDAPGQGAAARELQRRYGALMEIEDSAFRRANVAKRQQPESLAEQIAGAGAVGDLARGAWKLAHWNIMGAADIVSARAQRAGARFLKEQQTTDALIRRAFAAFEGAPDAVAMPAQPRIAGLLNRGPLFTPPPEDSSFVRGVPAQPVIPDRLALPPAGSPTRITPPPADTSFVRAEPGQYGARVPPVPPAQLPSGPTQGQLPPGRDRIFTGGPGELPVLEGEVLGGRQLPSGPSQRMLNAAPHEPNRVFEMSGDIAAAKPARVRAAKPSAPVQTPAAAASDVIDELRRVVDLKGAKSAGDVYARVRSSLQAELEPAQQAAGFKAVEFRGGKAYGVRGGVVMVDGEPIATVDRYGHMGWYDADMGGYTTVHGKRVPVKSTHPPSDFKAKDLTPTEHATAARNEVAKALGIERSVGNITIDIPGDGVFTIQRTPHAIQGVLDRLNRGGPTPWQGLVDAAKRPKGTEMPKPKVTW